MKKALITGVTGQDGAWLAKILLDDGYEVFGGMRRGSNRSYWRHDYLGITSRIKFVEMDLLDYSNVYDVIATHRPDEVYNLAAQSFVGVSFKQPLSTCQIDGMSVAYLLDVLKTWAPETRFYQASTSEMFGLTKQFPQNEETPFHPRSPYGCAKLFAHWMTVNYRESYRMFCCSGILFNHEGELRGPEFVTRKISRNAAGRHRGKKEVLELGNLDARRDWGHAQDFCRGMYLMMQQDRPDTYVLATGEMHSVRDFVVAAFRRVSIEVAWEGTGAGEVGRHKETGEILVRVNPEHFRPAEVEQLCGNASRARTVLDWEPRCRFEETVSRMVDFDLSGGAGN